MQRNRISEVMSTYTLREPDRYVQPLDFKKKALNTIGRARNGLAVILAMLEENIVDPREFARIIEKADSDCSVAQRHLLGKILLNEKGENG